ncbi:hypothetical protein DPMN_112761 [Dreissena polymorpha]|uniref:Uncharacterized protein n=1 Tax=Dreissena polymorpha TaxID=45954 RepID=A0A9D4KGB3_DREPO|nr:hypothetical protein DPMN_112761 [Dreissena polymorpha]
MARQRPTRLVMGPCIVEIDRIVIRDKFEVIQCRNEEVNFQGSSANSVGGAGGQGRRTDGRTDGRTSIQYPHFSPEKRGDNDHTPTLYTPLHSTPPSFVIEIEIGPYTFNKKNR